MELACSCICLANAERCSALWKLTSRILLILHTKPVSVNDTSVDRMLSIRAQAVFSSCVYVLAQSAALTLAY